MKLRLSFLPSVHRWALRRLHRIISRGDEASSPPEVLIRAAHWVLRRDRVAPVIRTVSIREMRSALGRPLMCDLILNDVKTSTSFEDYVRHVNGPWESAVASLRLASVEDRDRERSLSLYNLIHLSRSELTNEQNTAALRIVEQVAATIDSSHADPLFRACLTLAGGKPDPYDPRALSLQARATASALLQHHPLLDDRLIDEFKRGTDLKVARAVASAALKLRPDGRASTIERFLDAFKPSAKGVSSFLRDIDVQFSAERRLPDEEMRRLVGIPLGLKAVRFLPALFSSPALIGAAIWFHGEPDRSLAPQAGWGPALTSLGVLVAVHIVAAEMSANRLPGQIASHTSFSPSVVTAYSAAIGLVAVAAAASLRRNEVVYSVANVASTLLLVLLAGAVVVGMRALIRRTSPASAVRAFERSRLFRYWRFGQRIGRVQLASLACRGRISTMTHVQLVHTLSRTTHVVPLVANKRRVLLPSAARLERLGKRAAFAAGQVSLEVPSTLGTIIGRGEIVGALVPARDYIPLKRDIVACKSALHSGERTEVSDELSEAASQIVSMMAETARQGDDASAQRISEALVSLSRAHLAGISWSRRAWSPQRDEVLPVSTFIRTAVTVEAAALSASQSSTEREILTSNLQGLVGLGEPEDGAAVLIATRLVQGIKKGGRIAGSAREVLRECGARAIQDGDSFGIQTVRDGMETGKKTGADEWQWTEAAGSLVIAAVWTNYWRMQELWSWFWQLHRPAQPKRGAAALVGLRTAGVGLLSGNVSIAGEVSVSLSEFKYDFDDLATWIGDMEMGRREQALSDLYGRYLGDDAHEAMMEAARFVKSLARF